MPAGRPKGKGPRKVKITISLNEQLRKDMKNIENIVPVNWSQIIDDSLTPVVKIMKEAIEELGKGDKADLNKVKYLFQGNIMQFMGLASKFNEEMNKDITEAENKRKQVKKKRDAGLKR